MKLPFAERVEWELTRECDLNCQHCYNRPQRARYGELAPGEARRVARELADQGCRVVSLSGGEPLLRPDWADIATELSSRDVVVMVISNGQRLDLERAHQLADSGVTAVHLSVDGIGRTHDGIRRKPGAFLQIERALEALHAVGMPVGILTTLLRPNREELRPLARWVMAREVVVWQVWLGVPRHRAAGLWLNPGDLPGVVHDLEEVGEECPALTLGDNIGYHTDVEMLRQWDGVAAEQISAAANGAPAPCFTGCEAGRRTLGLRSDGAVTGCLALKDRPVAGTARTEGLDQLWRRAGRDRQERFAALTGSCRECTHAAMCRGGCHAVALNGRGEVDNRYCLRKVDAVERDVGTGRVLRMAQVAAGVMAAAALGVGGCGPKANQTEARNAAPVEAERRVRPQTKPAADPPPQQRPAAKGSPGSAGVPGTNAAIRSRAKPHRRVYSMPSCCYMHAIVPGCRCGKGPLLPAVRKPGRP